MHTWKVRNVQDDRGKFAQKFAQRPACTAWRQPLTYMLSSCAAGPASWLPCHVIGSLLLALRQALAELGQPVGNDDQRVGKAHAGLPRQLALRDLLTRRSPGGAENRIEAKTGGHADAATPSVTVRDSTLVTGPSAPAACGSRTWDHGRRTPRTDSSSGDPRRK